MPINNEAIGIAAEVAIARSFDVPINPLYERRADKLVLQHLLRSRAIPRLFADEQIPIPINHVAERRNPVDFILENNKTLSVKTNKNFMGKVAPQNIGQPTSSTFFRYLENNQIIKGFSIIDELDCRGLTDNYTNRALIFKELAYNNIDTLINVYFLNLFDCDFLILFYNLEALGNPINNYKVITKASHNLILDKRLFSFTRTLETWNESCTVKYQGISIGEFQIHKNRDCFKFRFIMPGLQRIMEENLI